MSMSKIDHFLNTLWTIDAPEAHKKWLQDNVLEIRRELNFYKSALTKAVSLPKCELPETELYYTWMENGNVIVEEKR